MTTTTKRTRKPTVAETVAKIHQQSLNMAPVANVPELLFVPLDAIETADQVRTEFDADSLTELAGDISRRGILQPLLLRRLESGRYQLIAGERRLRAARLAQLETVPALAGEVTDEAAHDMQLAENIQREDLSLADQAQAVRKLFDRLGSLQAVADRVHKSKPWVSKRVALTEPNFGWATRELLEQGFCEDLEILGIAAQLETLNHHQAARAAFAELANRIKAGSIGRTDARALLKATKAKIKAAQDPANQECAAKPRKAPAEQPAVKRNRLLWTLWHEIQYDPKGALLYPHHLSADDQQIIADAIKGAHRIGCDHHTLEPAKRFLAATFDANPHAHPLERFAYLLGLTGNQAGEPLPILVKTLAQHFARETTETTENDHPV